METSDNWIKNAFLIEIIERKKLYKDLVAK